MRGCVLFFSDRKEPVSLSQVKYPPGPVGQHAVVCFAHHSFKLRFALVFEQQEHIADGSPAPFAIGSPTAIAVLTKESDNVGKYFLSRRTELCAGMQRRQCHRRAGLNSVVFIAGHHFPQYTGHFRNGTKAAAQVDHGQFARRNWNQCE